MVRIGLGWDGGILSDRRYSCGVDFRKGHAVGHSAMVIVGIIVFVLTLIWQIVDVLDSGVNHGQPCWKILVWGTVIAIVIAIL